MGDKLNSPLISVNWSMYGARIYRRHSGRALGGLFVPAGSTLEGP